MVYSRSAPPADDRKKKTSKSEDLKGPLEISGYRLCTPCETLAGLELPPEKSPTKNSGRATAKPGDRGDAVLCPARSNPHDDEDEEEDEQQQ
ncbi:hypothetical protein HZH68_006333 [Vespula germanica]|uniref:Uncharacterized protein n=1 Tax=Vespula germanica TaxID=30212 RepID=A0A834KAM9_VESGE|nr:hypothetical protein HZH68_006333 [Vespula germanica]